MSDDSSASSTDEEMDGASPPRPWEGPADKPGVTRLPSCPLQPCIESCTPQLGPLTHQCSSRWCTQPIRGGLSFRDEPILRQRSPTTEITLLPSALKKAAKPEETRVAHFGHVNRAVDVTEAPVTVPPSLPAYWYPQKQKVYI